MAPNINNNERYKHDVEDIIRKDKKGMNPNAVDEILTKAMLSLSVKDRNDIQEEIHGVKCLAVEETPELIEQSLKKIAIELEKIPDYKKQAYLQSKNRPLSSSKRSEQERIFEELHPELNGPMDDQLETTYSSYIHGDEFRLRFLRCDCFDSVKAAKRLVNFLELLLDLFGDDALRRPISLSDFTKEELRHMRKGMIQLLPYRDRSGRRIVVFFPDEERSQIPPFTKAKITMYMGWVAGSNDVITQRKGLIVMAWFDSSFVERNESWKIKYKFYQMTSTRISAIHFCSPDTPHYRIRRAVATMRCGDEHLSKVIFSLGESVEVHYKLQSYGIPTEHIPISWTGKVKTQYLKQWMRIRQAIECTDVQHDTSTSEGSDSSSSLTSCAIIECPQFDDVVFRQGTSGVCHPGNVKFRSLIESILLQENESQRMQKQLLNLLQQEQHDKKKKRKIKIKIKRPKQLALDIYEERLRISSKAGRYLIWNNDKGWWNEIIDKEQILMKIEYMVREFQKLSFKSTYKSTSVRKKESRKETKIISLQSETNFFQAQDGGPFTLSSCCNFKSDADDDYCNSKKRERVSTVSFSSLEDGDYGVMETNKRQAECIDVTFSACLT
mmetsp:Transcript_15309/g.42484  ORF Transcript_15309/g.42484 Transcript_15309/m.42484 type:complete len:611 (+) Transcript_15309:263-2095(+)|eukprot:CAMPEP_0172360882 /NCGR_PEP_ID=MMETSP1060-20121228/4817_1 /TAXON_ID=37318 /ORGANISM="Pseudo-nitzschia pungens, Strain cf. cingulata" /LENGTH=610 /DNA_ID=CAMNT_0013082981 /DNA_START=172 /DNA_END=2004 /DNA_ORIENTATION=-